MKAVNKWLKRQSGHQRVTKRPPLYLTVATKQPPIDPKVVTKRSPNGHKLIGKWPQIDRKVATKWPSTHQFVKRPPIYPEEVNEWLTIDPKVVYMWLTNNHRCGFKAASNPKVVSKSKMVNKCLQKGHQASILESGPKVVTKQPTNYPKVVTK